LTCTYVETLASRKDLPINELNGTLQRMEDKLSTLIALSLSKKSHGSPASLHSASVATDSPGAESLLEVPRSSLQGELTRVLSSERHLTAPQHLLSWSCSPVKLSQAELQYPVALEAKRSNLPETKGPPRCLTSDRGGVDWLGQLSLSQLRLLTQLYFSHFHPSYMIVDEVNFYQNQLNHVLQNGFSQSVDTCIVLLVLGLGAVAAYHRGNSEWAPINSSPSLEVGLGFFNIAKDMFCRAEAVNWQSVQCLLLMA
jgi:hypothetical protein